MFRFLIICCFMLYMVVQPTFGAEKGEKQMANLILSEQFEGNTRQYYEDRGWFGGTVNGWGTGYRLEHDDTLNKQVLYANWDNGSTGEPNGGYGLRYRLRPEQTINGVSFHFTVKYHDVVSSNGRCHGMHRFGQNWGDNTPGNADGQIIIDPGRNGGGDARTITTDSQGNVTYPSNGNWQNGNQNMRMIWGGPNWMAVNTEHDGFLQDDVWYEIRGYLKPSHESGQNQNTAHMTLEYRKYGSTAWVTLLDIHNFNLVTSNPGQLTHFMMGPYLHNNLQGDPRMYIGSILLYEGDAISDGTMDSGGTTDPEPIDEGTSEFPIISNFSLTQKVNSATVSWDTNKDTNSVLDYGPTETRGTEVRNDVMSQSHMFVLSDLTPDTKYYYRYSSRDADGNTVFDRENKSFTTLSESVSPPPVVEKVTLADIEGFEQIGPLQAGQGMMYDGQKWVAINLEDEVIKILQERTKLTVS